jgi:phosphoribosylformylglycinamidine synthase
MHTPTRGGLGVSLAKMAFAGGYGLEVSLDKVPLVEVTRNDDVLFSESNSRFLVTVPSEKIEAFEREMMGSVFERIGVVTEEKRLKIRGLSGDYIIDVNIKRLKETWKSTLKDV